jgi:chromosome partitioning protein
MKILAISNHKGGVGKTTTTINLGAALAELGHSVLLIDLDAQANLTQSLGLTLEAKTICGAIEGRHELEPVEVAKNLYAIPSALELAAISERIITQPGSDHILQVLIERLTASRKFNYILIDCPPTLSKLTINAFTAANQVYIPLQAEYLALQGLGSLVEAVNLVKARINKKLTIGGVVVTQYDSRRILNKEVVAAIETHLPGKVFTTKIRENIAIAEAPTRGLDVIRYNPKSNGAKDYRSLAREVVKRK